MAAVIHLLAIVLVAGAATAAFGQPSTGQPDPQPSFMERLKERMKEPDQAGGFHLTEHFAVAFGGIQQGSGIALGPAYSTKFRDGGFVQLKAVFSIKKFKLLQARYDTRRFWSDRAIAISRLRWLEAPELSLFQLGQDSPEARAQFGARRTEGSTRIVVKATKRVRVAAGFGVERYAISTGKISSEDGNEALPEVPQVPGLGTRPLFTHGSASVAFDTRLSPDYSRSGRLLETALHDYHDWRDEVGSFRRLEGTAQQLVPTHGSRGVIDLSARTWLTSAGDGRPIPFFLMPTLGGGDLLRAFRLFRFRDRHALLLKGEYRWAVHPFVDVAGVYEAGKVAPEVKGLGLRDMAQSVGLGIRVHTESSSLFRADVAHGREGFGFRIGFNPGGS
jgi:hypothetical protein